MLVCTYSKDTKKDVMVAMETETRTPQAVAMRPGTFCAAAKRRWEDDTNILPHPISFCPIFLSEYRALYSPVALNLSLFC